MCLRGLIPLFSVAEDAADPTATEAIFAMALAAAQSTACAVRSVGLQCLSNLLTWKYDDMANYISVIFQLTGQAIARSEEDEDVFTRAHIIARTFARTHTQTHTLQHLLLHRLFRFSTQHTHTHTRELLAVVMEYQSARAQGVALFCCVWRGVVS